MSEENPMEIDLTKAVRKVACNFAVWLNKNRWFNYENGKWHYTYEHGTSVSDAMRQKHFIKTSEELYDKFLTEEKGRITTEKAKEAGK